jgi:hypothetical protein
LPSKSKAVPKTKAPRELSEFQDWFSRAASRPLLPGNRTRPRGVGKGRAPSLRLEAEARLQNHNGMSGLERLEVYNRQYWFRLITCLQEDYLCTVHVMGLDRFNEWVIRFLDARPAVSPYLAELDRRFPSYLAKHYEARNKAVVLEAVSYDKAFARAFEGANAVPPVADAKHPARQRLVLSPHATVVGLTRDFRAYRALCAADEALTGRFPLKARRHAVCLYRLNRVVYEKELSSAERRVLAALEKPRTLSQLFRFLEQDCTLREMKAIERGLADWFRDWTELGILSNHDA